MNLHVVDFPLAVVRLEPSDPIPDFALKSPFFSITKTATELSLFLAEDCVPEGMDASTGWRAFHIEGTIDLGLTGVISALTMPLATKQISVFSISTHDTDYLIVPDDRLEDAIELLQRAGFQWV
jgi:hypothetical protein|tara:strand:+ start:3697 stop:4068 length:372 start_codon:yes stop_codon:yes gene_type:complete